MESYGEIRKCVFPFRTSHQRYRGFSYFPVAHEWNVELAHNLFQMEESFVGP